MRAGRFFFVALMMAAIVQRSAAQTFTVLHEFLGAPNDGSGPRGGLLRDGAGNFFGTTFSGGGASEGTVHKSTPNGQESVPFCIVLRTDRFRLRGWFGTRRGTCMAPPTKARAELGCCFGWRRTVRR